MSNRKTQFSLTVKVMNHKNSHFRMSGYLIHLSAYGINWTLNCKFRALPLVKR